MNDFRKLDIWKRSKKLCVDVYQLTNEFPKSEIYGLSSQIKRCSISIPSNIAEGSSRKSSKEYSRFISIALGSAYELETQLDIAFELKFINENQLNRVKGEVVQVQKMIFKFREHISKNL